jgi:hypothetical protein
MIIPTDTTRGIGNDQWDYKYELVIYIEKIYKYVQEWYHPAPDRKFWTTNYDDTNHGVSSHLNSEWVDGLVMQKSF